MPLWFTISSERIQKFSRNSHKGSCSLASIGLQMIQSYRNATTTTCSNLFETDLSELVNAGDTPIEMRKSQEIQTTSIFRWDSGGRVDNRQHEIDIDYTAGENAHLCASLLRFPCSRRFGHFDLKEMHSALSRSKIFAQASSIPNA